MRIHPARWLGLLALAAGSLALVPASAAPTTTTATQAISLAPLGSYSTGLGEASAEIAAYSDGRLYITNSEDNSLDIVDISNPATPALLTRIDLAPYGGGPNSVAVRPAAVAVAVEAEPKTDPGKVVFFSRDGVYLNQVTVGALPDMLTYGGRDRYLLVANEGEPSSYGQADSVDPEGSISLIDMTNGALGLTQNDVTTLGFGEFNAGGPRHGELPAGVRIFGPGASVAQDLEPEYISISGADSAYVSLQENNALAVIDLNSKRISRILALGSKNHNLPGNGLDASDRDGKINITNWPVKGFFMPDTIDSFTLGSQSYIVTANEGDARDYDGLEEEIRVGNNGYKLDATAFPNATDLKKNANLGRLTVTRTNGDRDGDGDYDEIYAFGARSFSIFTSKGELVFDSGSQFEQITAAAYPAFFNTGNDENVFDSRSDNKGPEPEGLALGVVDGKLYAFIGLERIGGLMVYDLSNPRAPQFVQYVNNRDFSTAEPAGDLGPEGVSFIGAAQSPTGQPLVVVSNEISGSVTVYRIQ